MSGRKSFRSDDERTARPQQVEESSETEYSEWDRRSGQESGAPSVDPNRNPLTGTGGAASSTSTQQPRQRVKKTTEQRNMESKLPVVLEANAPWSEAKKRSVKERVFWSCVMVSVFAGIIAMGHLYLAFLVICLTMGMFREVIGLKRNKEKDNKIPWFLTMRWYFFVLAEFYAIKRLLPPSTELESNIRIYGGHIPYLLFVKYYPYKIIPTFRSYHSHTLVLVFSFSSPPLSFMHH
mmetsp:Transcript_16649/g.41187  ORF Transcript_16649/g.41187 Transcript_16649/m.41187 type:complete len:236 (+) Transcript_16649:448-1155(+)